MNEQPVSKVDRLIIQGIEFVKEIYAALPKRKPKQVVGNDIPLNPATIYTGHDSIIIGSKEQYNARNSNIHSGWCEPTGEYVNLSGIPFLTTGKWKGTNSSGPR